MYSAVHKSFVSNAKSVKCEETTMWQDRDSKERQTNDFVCMQ
jgi:hypothetical protein